MCEQAENTVQEFNINEFKEGNNYVIDASAGTGKTYTIVEMVKKLISSGVTLDKMLIVTYTEKAAGELKDRIRSGLAEMGDDIRNEPKNDVDNASIGTIHAFCQNIINEYFISAGKPSCQKLIDESEIKAFLKRYIRKGEIYEDICRYKKDHIDKDVENSLIKKITANIEKYYLNNKYENDTIISFSEDTMAYYESDIIKKLYQSEFDNYKEIDIISNALGELENSCSLDSKRRQRAVDFCNEVRQSNDLSFNGRSFQERWFDGCDKENFNIIKQASDFIKNDEYINCIVFNYLSDIYKAWQKEKENLCVQTYNDMIRNVREEVLKTDSKLLTKLREKYTYAIIDEFQDTNQKQWDIFGTVFLSEGHNLIVVGDPKQSIYSFQGADVTVYEKAKNEIEEKGGNIRALKKNFRATADIIKSTNAFFNNSDTLPEGMDFNPSDVGNDKFKAEYNGKTLEHAFWITEEEVSPEDYAKIVCNRIVDFCTKENGKTKLQIWDNKGKQRDVSFKDFAVLARTRSEMKPIQDAFEKCGIPYTQYKDQKLFSGKECADWLAILEAINVPDFTGYNRQFFKKAMLSAFFGYTLNDLQLEKFDRDSTNEFGLFDDWRQLAEKREWAKLIERIIVDTEVAQKLDSLGEIKAFGVLMQIGDYCADYLTKNENLEMLIRNLRNQSTNDNDEEDEENSSTVAKATAMDCVQMMTIHASKGLEFPVVISVSGHKSHKTPDAYSYHLKDENGITKNYLAFSSTGNSSNRESEEEFKRLYYVAYTRAKYLLMLPQYAVPKSGRTDDNQLKFISESIITFKDKCKSIANGEAGNDNCLYAYTSMPLETDNKSLEDLAKAVKLIYQSNAKETEASLQEEIAEQIEKLENFNPYFRTPHKHAYSSLSHGGERHLTSENAASTDTYISENGELKHNHEEETENVGLSGYDTSAKVIECAYDSNKDPIELSPNFIAGTGIGNVLHRVFELIDYTDESTVTDELIKACFAEEKIRCKDEWIADIKNMVHHVLHAKLPAIKGNQGEENGFSLNELDNAHRKNEVEFNYNIEGKTLFSHYMNGFVDLIFERDGYYSILDWKSDRINADFTVYNDKDVLKVHVDELYSIQRVLYSYCLIKWLSQIFGGTEQEVFEQHFGGVYYIFLRGCNENTGNGVYAQTWKSFDVLKKEYKNIVEKRVY